MGPSGFPLKTENMNGELFVNELIIALSTLVQSYKLEEAIYLLLLRINNVNSIPRHVAEEDEFVSHHCIATERTVIPGKIQKISQFLLYSQTH